MGWHFLAAKANWDFLPNLPFLPILLNVLIVTFSLVGLLVGAVCRYRDAAVRWRARRARGSCDEEMPMLRSGCCESGRQAVSQNWNPLRDHYFNNDIFVQYLHAMLKKREAKSILAGSEMCHIFSPLIDSRVVCKVLTLPTICVFICMLVSQSNAEIPILKFQFSCRSRIRVM